MPTPAYLEIIAPNGEVTFRDLNLEQEVATIGGHPDNEIVIADPGVAPFVALLTYRPTLYELVILSDEIDAKLGGRPLSLNTPTRLQNWDIVELAGYKLILCANGADIAAAERAAIPPARLSTSPNRPPSITHPHDQWSNHISTALSAQEWTVEVAQSAICRLTIANRGHKAADFLTGVEGVDPGWVAVSPQAVHLRPGEQASVTISLTPPRSAESLAGHHPLAILVTSPGYPGQANRHQAALIIKSYYDFSVGELRPKQQTLSWLGQAGHLIIPVSNKGNCEARLRLEGRDKDESCSFEFQAPKEPVRVANRLELQVQPGETTLVSAYITPPARPLIKSGKDSHFCTITTTMLARPQPARTVLAQIHSAPLIGPGLMTLFALLLVTLVGLTAQQIINNAPTELVLVQQNEANRPDNGAQRPLTALNTGRTTPVPAAETVIENAPTSAGMTYEEIFKEVAEAYDLEWQMLAEQAYRESRLNYLAVGQAGEMGLMQIMPATWDEWAPKVGVSDSFDPYSNVLVSGAYLAFLKGYFNDLGYSEDDWMLAAYNWGPHNLRQHLEAGGAWEGIPAITRYYAGDILQISGTGGVRRVVYEGMKTRVAVDRETRETRRAR